MTEPTEAERAFIRVTQLAQQWEINAQSASDPIVAALALVAAGQIRAALATPLAQENK